MPYHGRQIRKEGRGRRAPSQKTVGILGGMGPEATAALFHQIILNTPVKGERDHLRMLIDSNPKIPSRPDAIRGKGPSPAAAMIEGGADP